MKKALGIAAILTVVLYHFEGAINGLVILPLAAVGLYILIDPHEQDTTLRQALAIMMEADDAE